MDHVDYAVFLAIFLMVFTFWMTYIRTVRNAYKLLDKLNRRENEE